MQCDTKTMIKVALGLAVVVAGAYAFIPVARVLIIAAVPFLFFLVCPISMILMMKSMNSNSCRTDRAVDVAKLKTSVRSETPKREAQ